MTWDFNRAMVAYGNIIESGAEPVIQRALQFAKATLQTTRFKQSCVSLAYPTGDLSDHITGGRVFWQAGVKPQA